MKNAGLLIFILFIYYFANPSLITLYQHTLITCILLTHLSLFKKNGFCQIEVKLYLGSKNLIFLILDTLSAIKNHMGVQMTML